MSDDISVIWNAAGPLSDATAEARAIRGALPDESETAELVENAVRLMESAQRLLAKAMKAERREGRVAALVLAVESKAGASC